MILRSIFTLIMSVMVITTVTAQDALPEGEGRLIIEDVCTTCHDLVNITKSRRSHEQWQHIVDTMIAQGAPLREYEVDTVVDYLSEHFGK